MLFKKRMRAQKKNTADQKKIEREVRELKKTLARWEEAYATGKMEADYFLELANPLRGRIKKLEESITRYKSARMNPLQIRNLISNLLKTLPENPKALGSFIRKVTLHPRANGKRKLDISLSVRLPKERKDKLSYSMVAVRGIEPRSDG